MQNRILTDDELDRLLTDHMPKANMLLAWLEEERDKNTAGPPCRKSLPLCANGDRIMVFKQSIITNRELRIDTEDTEIKEIKIGEHIINYIFNKGMYNAYWN